MKKVDFNAVPWNRMCHVDRYMMNAVFCGYGVTVNIPCLKEQHGR